jgi:hypothetical protein
MGPAFQKHKIVHASSSMDIIKNFSSVYDTFQSNLAELKISKTFHDLDNAKTKWAHEKEQGGPPITLSSSSKGSNFQKFRAVK